MIKLKSILTEGVNASDLKYQMKMSLEDSGIGAKALIGMKPKGKDYFLKMKSYMYRDSMDKVLKHVNSVLKTKLKVKDFKNYRFLPKFYSSLIMEKVRIQNLCLCSEEQVKESVIDNIQIYIFHEAAVQKDNVQIDT